MYLFILILHCCANSYAINLIANSHITSLNKIENLLGSHMEIPILDKVISDIIANRGIEKYKAGLNNEDKDLNINQLIQKYSCPPEEHHVRTRDGYILTLFRIPGKGTPVFFMHGLFCSAKDWITLGSGALPYLLAALGYDVWLGNGRGNKYSRKHECLSPDSKEFWDFSWDEIGRYDLPASIDYVLCVTGHQQLKYIGHSMGTTAFFVMCSELPEYNKKIYCMVAMSAVAWISHMKSPLFRLLVPLKDLLNATFSALGIYEFFPNRGFTKILTRYICGSSELASLICTNLMFLVAGFDYPQLNITNMPVVFSHVMAGASKNQILHYVQEIESANFCRFDYGEVKNLAKYGSKKPPTYPVEKITVPVAIMHGHGDWVVDDKDVDILARKLKNLVCYYKVPVKEFSHSDFLWAKDVKELVYLKVIQLLKKC